MQTQNASKQQLIFVSAGLVLLIGAAFEPIRHNGFVRYDDEPYITQNAHVLQGLTRNGIRWSFTADNLTANWHPLTWLSHMLDVELFGLNPLGHHLHNLFLHMVSSILLFWLLCRMTGALWCSVFVATVFGIHPLRVESVAWAAERKDCLSVLFFMLTIAAYLYYVNKGGISRYLLIVLCFALGLMAKPMLVTLPIVLLILDFWPLKNNRSISLARLIAEKIPLFILALISCIITYQVQQEGGGKMIDVPLIFRISNIPLGYVSYIGKMFWPVNLAVLYPYSLDRPLWQAITAFLVLLVITGFVIYRFRRYPWLAAGWAWYGITLIPVIGLVQVGVQATADRYTYLPSIGVAVMFSWAIARLSEKWPYRKMILGIFGGLLAAAMIMGTRTQLAYWKDTTALFEHTLAVTDNNFIMHYNMGTILLKQDRLREAADHFGKALEIMPDFPSANIDMAAVFSRQKQPDEAIDCLGKALKSQPDNVDANINMAAILIDRLQFDEAVNYLRKALEIQPDSVEANNNMAVVLMNRQQFDKATNYLHRVLKVEPDNGAAYYRMGIILESQGNIDPAINAYEYAVQLNPKNAEAYNNLGVLKGRKGLLDQAIESFRMSLQIESNSAQTCHNLGFALQKQGNIEEAILYYRMALKIEPNNYKRYWDLASCLHASGKSQEAIETAQKAIDLAKSAEQTEMIEAMEKRLQLYRTEKSTEDSPAKKQEFNSQSAGP